MNLTLNNLKTIGTIRRLNEHANLSSKSLEKITSGKSINIAADNASGLGININMNKTLLSQKQYIDNIQDGISMLVTADRAIDSLHSQVQRIRKLTIQAGNETLTSEDRQHIQLEINELIQEINRFAQTANYNQINLLRRIFQEDLSVIGDTETGIASLDVTENFNKPIGEYRLEVFEAGPLNPQIDISQINTTEETALDLTPSDPSDEVFQDLKGTIGGVFGQKFVANEQNISSVEFKIRNHTGNITVELYSDTPESHLLATKSKALNIVGEEWVKFDFTNGTNNPINLNKDENYFISIISDDPNFDIALQDPADPQYANGYIYREGFDHYNDTSLAMKVNAIVPQLDWEDDVTVADGINAVAGTITMVSDGGDNWTVTHLLENGVEDVFNYVAGNVFDENGIQFNLKENPFLSVGDTISFEIYREASFEGGPRVRVGANSTSILRDNLGNELVVTFGDEVTTGVDDINVRFKDFETVKFHVADNSIIDTGLPALFSPADLQINDIDVVNFENIGASLQKLDNALNVIHRKTTELGSVIKRFENMINLDTTSNINLSKVISNLQDTDYYSEITNFFNKDLLVKSSSYLNEKSFDSNNQVKNLLNTVLG